MKVPCKDRTERINTYVLEGGLLEWLRGCGLAGSTMAVSDSRFKSQIVVPSTRMNVLASLQCMLTSKGVGSNTIQEMS